MVNSSRFLPGLPASARLHRLTSYTPVMRFLEGKQELFNNTDDASTMQCFSSLKFQTHPSAALRLPVPKRLRIEREAESLVSRE